MFFALAIFSLIQAILEKKPDLVAMLVAVIGFFVFIVIDHVDQAAAIEKLEATVQQLAAPLNFIRAEQIRSQGASDAQRVERISSTKQPFKGDSQLIDLNYNLF